MIIRRRYNSNFTVLSNAVFEDSRLSPEALGVLVYLRSRPEAWNVELVPLGARFRMGRDKTQRVIGELVDAGWIKRERTRDPITRAYNGIDYIVYDEPEAINDNGLDDEPQPENPVVGREPQPEKPRAANPVVHIEETNTEREKITPLTPKGAGVGLSKSGLEEGQGGSDELFDVLLGILQPDPAFSRPAAARAWSRIDAADRAEAVACAPRYVDHCRSAKRKICDPATYLRERRWANFVNLPVAAKADVPQRTAETDPVLRSVQWALSADRNGWHFVEQGSDAWEAWREAFVAVGFGRRWSAARRPYVQGTDGKWAPSIVPGNMFPMRYPAKREATTDPPDRPSPAEIEQHLGG